MIIKKDHFLQFFFLKEIFLKELKYTLTTIYLNLLDLIIIFQKKSIPKTVTACNDSKFKI